MSPFTDKVNEFLNSFTEPFFILDQVCKKENQDSFLEIVRNRADYSVNGNHITKKGGKPRIETIEAFFKGYTHQGDYSGREGNFTNENFTIFVSGFIKAAKCQKYPKEKNYAISVLWRLMNTLSTKTVNCSKTKPRQ